MCPCESAESNLQGPIFVPSEFQDQNQRPWLPDRTAGSRRVARLLRKPAL
jgi:hypothetical protein